MTTFDMAKQIADTKTKAFAISNDIRDAQAAAGAATAVTITPTVDLSPALDNAFRTHIESQLPTREALDPSMYDMMKAAFQSGNMVGSALSSESTAEKLFPTRDAQEMTDAQIVEEVGQLGLSPLLQQFQGVTNKAQFDARANDLVREQKNMEIMEASGWPGVGAALVAGIVDIPTLIPIGKAVQLGRAGASLGETAGKVAAAGAIDATISEAGLQATQELRTGTDTALNVVSSAILGAGLGVGVHTIVGASKAAEISTKFDDYRQDAAEGFPRAQAAEAQLEAEFAAVNKGEAGPEVAPVVRNDVERAVPDDLATQLDEIAKRSTELDPRQNRAAMRIAGENKKLLKEDIVQAKKDAAATRRSSPKLGKALTAIKDYDDAVAAVKAAGKSEDVSRINRAVTDAQTLKEGLAGVDTPEAKAFTVEVVRIGDTGNLDVVKLKELAAKVPGGKAISEALDNLDDAAIAAHKSVSGASYKLGALNADTISLAKEHKRALDTLAKSEADIAQLDSDIAAIKSYYAAPAKGQSTLDANTTPGATASAGAAFSDVAADFAKAGKNADAKVSAMLFDKLPSITTAPTEFLARILGGKTLLGRPRDAFRLSDLDTVRTFQRMFYSSPEISQANTTGKANFKGMTVEDHIGEDAAQLAIFKAEVENVYAANKGSFKNADDLAERAYYAALNLGTDTVRGDPAVEAVARAFNKYTAYQHAKHVANNRLPEDTPTMGTPGGYVRRVYNQTALRNNEDTAREMLFQWAKRKVTQDVEEVLSETGYTENLRRYEESVASYPDRVTRRKTDFEQAMADWRTTRDNIIFEDNAAYERDMVAWRQRVEDWGTDPKNDGKKHPYGKQKPLKKNYDTEVPPRPRQKPEETITDGNPKPALPKNKYGVPMLRENINEYARLLSEDVYNTVAGVKSSVPRAASSRVGVRTGYLKGRVIDIPDDALAENFFLRTNLNEIAEMMHYTSGRDAAFGSVFKTARQVTDPETGNAKTELVGDYDGNSILKAVEEEADAVINETTGEAKTALINERDRMLNGIKNEIAIARGSFDVGYGLIGNKAAHVMASISYAVRLGGVTVSSLTDAPKLAIANGIGNTFRYGVLPLFTDFRAAMRRGGRMRDQGIRTGNVIEVLHNTRMADTFELHNPHKVGDKWENFINKATNKATQLSLISHWTDFVKQIGHNVASSRILGYADMGYDRLSQKNRAWLANLGIEADDLAKIKDQYGKQDLKHVAGILYADLDKWSDPELAARFAAAFRREGRNVVVSPGLGDRPQFMHTPEGKLIYQFQTFMLTDQIRFVARQAQLANTAGNDAEKMRQRIAFGAGLSSLVLGAVFVDSMKRALRDNDADWDEFTRRWQDNPGGSAYDAIDRAGFMGSLFSASNTFGRLSNGTFSIRGGAQWLAGDKNRADARKMRDVSLGGALLGPTAGMAQDLTMAFGVVPMKVAAGGSLTRHDLNRYQNLLPFHAVPGIQQALNELKDLTAAGIGLPPEAPHMGR